MLELESRFDEALLSDLNCTGVDGPVLWGQENLDQ